MTEPTFTFQDITDLIGDNYGADGYGSAALALNALWHGSRQVQVFASAVDSDDLPSETFINALYWVGHRLDTAAELAARAILAERKAAAATVRDLQDRVAELEAELAERRDAR